MKKPAAAIIALTLLLCAGALADEPITISAREDGGVYEFTGAVSENAEGAEYLYVTEYGYLSLNADGTYVYTYDASREFEEGAADDFMISYKTGEGDTYTTAISVPAGENAEGNAVGEGLVTENASFATEHCYIRVENGKYTVTVKNWAIQYLSGGELLEETFTVIENGAREIVFNINITGADDTLTAQSAKSACAVGEDGTATGRVKASGGDGDITFGGAKGAKYGTLKLSADGTYTYTLDETNPAVAALKKGETLTDEISFTARDKDGSRATGKIVITIKVGNKKPAFPQITQEIDEKIEGGCDLPALYYPHTLGDGTEAEHKFKWTTKTENYGTFSVTDVDRLYYKADGAKLRTLGEGETATDYAAFKYTDADGDSVESRVVIILRGVDSKPSTIEGTSASFSEKVAKQAEIKHTIFLKELGDGTAAEHTFTAESTDNPSFVQNIGCAPDGSITFTLDTDDPNVYKMNDGDKKLFTIRYTVTDKDGDSAETEITVGISGETHKPAAEDVTITVSESSGGTQTVYCTEYLNTGDGPLSGHTVEVTKSPEKPVGNIAIGGDCEILYALNTGDSRVYLLKNDDRLTDEYTLKATDCDGHSATFKVTITVRGESRAPKAKNITVNLTEGASANDVVDTFDYITLGDGPKSAHSVVFDDTLKYVWGTKLEKGQYGYTDKNADAAVIGLGEGEVGKDVITYTVTDADGDSAKGTITFNVMGVDSFPEAYNATVNITVSDAATVTYTEMTKFLYARGDGDFKDYQVTLTPVSAKNGTSTVKNGTSVQSVPSADIAKADDPSVTYTDTYTYTIKDADGDSSTTSLTINYKAQNKYPRVSAPTVTANPANGYEVSGDALASATLGNGTAADHKFEWGALKQIGTYGTFTILEGGGFKFKASDELIEYLEDNPTMNVNIMCDFSYADIDGDAAKGTLKITITTK